jgi:Integrase core domain
MGSVGDCFDNAMCESFFATLECELLNRRGFKSQIEARMAIFEFIEDRYNPQRRHSAINYLPPLTSRETIEKTLITAAPHRPPKRGYSTTICRDSWKRGSQSSSISLTLGVTTRASAISLQPISISDADQQSRKEANYQTSDHRITTTTASTSGRLNFNPMAHSSPTSSCALSQLF